MSNEKQPWHTLCGLWLSENKQSMNGSLGMVRIAVFKNENKRSDKSPDYWLKVVPQEERKERRQSDRVYSEAPQQHDDENPTYEDIPF